MDFKIRTRIPMKVEPEAVTAWETLAFWKQQAVAEVPTGGSCTAPQQQELQSNWVYSPMVYSSKKNLHGVGV